MQVCEIPVLQNYGEYFQPKIQKFGQGKYIQIIILRETKSYTVFSIDGQRLHIERTPAGMEITHPIDRAIMHELKQLIPERQTGRGLLRQFNFYPFGQIEGEIGVSKDSECDIFKQACGICPDCLLYGSITTSAEDSGSRQGRAMADSGFLIRSLSQVIRNLKFGDTNGIKIDLQRENLMPEIFIPTVETLVDVTKEEFVYVMGNILKTTRYCTEEGFIRNHIVGIYFSDMEVFSNLEMSQSFYDIMSAGGSVHENLGLQDFTDKIVPMANECIKRSVGRITMLTDDEICELLHDISVIYSDQEYLSNFLKSLSRICYDYIHQLAGNGKIQNNLSNPHEPTVLQI